jgi:hypothetical protein
MMTRRLCSAILMCAPIFLTGGVAPARGQVPRLGQPAPEIAGGPWLNSAPLTLQGLRGRVVLVEFWTYG